MGLWVFRLLDQARTAQTSLEFYDKILQGTVHELPYFIVYSVLHPIQESIPDNQIKVLGGLHLQKVLISSLLGQPVLNKLLAQVCLQDLVRNEGKESALAKNLNLLLLDSQLHRLLNEHGSYFLNFDQSINQLFDIVEHILKSKIKRAVRKGLSNMKQSTRSLG